MSTEQRILPPEWRAENEANNYPFSDDATLVNDAGIFVPPETFLDAVVYPLGGGVGMRLSKGVVSHAGVRLYIGDEVNDELCSGFVPFADAPAEIRLLDVYDRDAGLLVSDADRLGFFQAWPVGTHLFDREHTELVDRVCTPGLTDAVTGFLLDDGTVISDDAWFVGGDGVALVLEEAVDGQIGCLQTELEPGDKQVIRVHAVGDPLYRRRLCGDAFPNPQFIRSITFRNGGDIVACGPNDLGDIQVVIGNELATDTVLRLRATSDGLIFEAVGEPSRNPLGGA